jgi:hypothetical protein
MSFCPTFLRKIIEKVMQPTCSGFHGFCCTMLSTDFFANFSGRKIKMDKNKCPFPKFFRLSFSTFSMILI